MTTKKRNYISAALLAAVVLVPTTAKAQSTSMGVTAGVTLSNIKTDNDVDLKNIWGGLIGLTAVRTINPNFGIQVEALLNQKGAGDLDVTGRKFRLAYVDVPVLARFGRTTTNKTHFHVFTGPVPSFRVKADLKDEDSDVSVDLKDETKAFDLGWTLGVGAERGPISLGVRYTMGLSNIDDTNSNVDYKNRSWAFTVGYRFR